MEGQSRPDLWIEALREKDAKEAASRCFTPVPSPLLPVAAPEPPVESTSLVEIVKTGAKWIGKGYLLIVALMFAVMAIAGFLSDPIGSLTGGCVTSSQCTD